MKEPSIEQKAQAYDGNYKTYAELINRLEDVKDAIKKQNYGIAMDILYKPYPQFQVITHSTLKESEYEKIRKILIDYFDDFHLPTFAGLDPKKILAWLEKQGEQKPTAIQIGRNYKCIVPPRYTCFKTNFVYKPCDEFLCGLMNFCSDCFEPIENDEQKPADKSDLILNILNKENLEVQREDLIKKPSLITVGENETILSDVISILDNGFMPSSMERARLVKGLQYIKLQSSSVWSEEDEKNLNEALSYIKDETLKTFIKDRVQPQLRQEWSEKDNKIIEEIINDIECAKAINYHAPKEGYEFRENWLKSLKPQSQWKPSDEQMHYLFWIANIKLGDSVVEQEVSKHLNELYEDLLKLKG